MKDIYELELHESIEVKSPDDDFFPLYRVMRVIGGWIYETGPNLSPTFVPFNDEFHPHKE